MIKTAHINILEPSVVSLSAGAEDAAYPLYRLYDRRIGRLFKASGASDLAVLVDQGASGAQAVDRLLIPSGHNLSGMALSLEHSSDGSSWTPAVAAWTGASGLIDKPFTSVASRYWRFKVTGPASPPELAELFLTSTDRWEGTAPRPSAPAEDLMNAEAAATASGHDRFLLHGEPRRQRTYKVEACGNAQVAGVLTLYGAWKGARPFWLYDHDGQWIFGRLAAPLDVRESGEKAYALPWAYDFNFLEVLA
jgi:hypothetical protein